MRQWLKGRAEKNIAVVGHGHCLKLTVKKGSLWEIISVICFLEGQNRELRSYKLDSMSEDDQKLEEIKEQG